MKEPKKTAASLQSKRNEEPSDDSGLQLNIDDIGDILKMLSEHDVVEFEFERGEHKLWLKRSGAETAAPKTQFVQAPIAQPMLQAAPAPAEQAAPQAESAPIPLKKVPEPEPEPVKPAPVLAAREVTSPMVGTFYRRPAVDAEPYVDVGDMVKKGDVLCIVEAMKIMNEIEADTAGRVVEVCLDDGQMVEYGEVMFRIEKS